MYVETENNENNLVRLWHVKFTPISGIVNQASLVTSLIGPPNDVELAYMSISPSGHQLALMAGTSQLTPMYTLQIIQIPTDVV
jgi:hypothetical protein